MEGFAETKENICSFTVEANKRCVERLLSDDIIYHTERAMDAVEYPEDKPDSVFMYLVKINHRVSLLLGINLDEYTLKLSREAYELGSHIMSDIECSVREFIEGLDMHYELAQVNGVELKYFQEWNNLYQMVENHIGFKDILRLRRNQENIFDEIIKLAEELDKKTGTDISDAAEIIRANAQIDYDIQIAKVRTFKTKVSSEFRIINMIISDTLAGRNRYGEIYEVLM